MKFADPHPHSTDQSICRFRLWRDAVLQFYESTQGSAVKSVPTTSSPTPHAFVIAHQQWIQIDESTENLKEKKSATTKWEISAPKVRSSSTQSISFVQES